MVREPVRINEKVRMTQMYKFIPIKLNYRPEKDERQQNHNFAYLQIFTVCLHYLHGWGLGCRTTKWREVGDFCFTANVRINQSPD